jgi:uncharacterized protein YraI
MKKLAFLLVLLAAACTTPMPTATPSPTTPPTRTITLPPTITVSPQPSTATPTQLLIEGTLSIKVNVRNGPATTYSSLGQLDAGQKVQIFFLDATGTWFQILYPPAPQGIGWIAARYITIPSGTQVPRITTPTPTGPTGMVIQRLNVRSGPGMDFATLGMLDPNQVISLTGKNKTASWFQINYPTGPGGHGWVTAQYVQTDASAKLPVLDDYGNVVTPGAPGTPSSSDLTPTPTIGPAYADGDTSANPAVRVVFSANGTNKFIYSDQVSAPQGDTEDWIEFTPHSSFGSTARLSLSLTCTGNSTLTVELWQNGTSIPGWGSLACGDTDKAIRLTPDQVYQLRLVPTAGAGLQFVAYTLTVQNNP